jgi:hypothetical protein
LDDNNEIAYDRHGRATILPGVGERLATQRLCATAGMGRFIWAADYFGWPKP